MTIPYFPPAYPEESLYSRFARLNAEMAFPRQQDLSVYLFGAAQPLTLYLSPQLSALARRLPAAFHLSLKSLLDSGTLWPLTAPFLERKRLEHFVAALTGQRVARRDWRVERPAVTMPKPRALCYCPACAEEDSALVGERYWRRLFQAALVLLCPRHNLVLRSSAVRVGDKRWRHMITAEEALAHSSHSPQPPGEEFGGQACAVLLQLANDIDWLLSHPGLGVDLTEVRGRYRALLLERGLTTWSGRLRLGALVNAFLQWLPPEVAARMQDADGDGKWVAQVLREGGAMQPPARHLLVMQWLGVSAEAFFSAPEEVRLTPFGAGPWPCLNPVAPHYQRPVIATHTCGYDAKCGTPIGVFACACGFTYSRSGPDRGAEDRMRLRAIRAYGPVWDAALRTAWQDAHQSLVEIGRTLGVAPATLGRHAARLALPFPRPGGRRASPPTRPQRGRPPGAPDAAKRRRYRKRMQALLARYPEGPSSRLRALLPRQWEWLYTYDRAWHTRSIPPVAARAATGRPARIDWAARDQMLATRVREAYHVMCAGDGASGRVTKRSLRRMLGAADARLISNQLSRLPLTRVVLAEVVETGDGHAARRPARGDCCAMRE
jgi:hypothetical protein